MSDSTQVSASRAITVPFHGADLYVVEHNGQPYTPMKPIVEGMGLTWPSQFRKLSANKDRWGIAVMETPLQGVSETETPSGGVQKMLSMPLRKLPGWLATIESGKVKSDKARAAVIQYQNECDDVLWQYWNDGVAINPRAVYSVNPGDKLTAEEAESLRLMLKTAADRQPKAKQAALMVQGWSKLKAHFKVGYREIPRHEFSEAVSIIARHTAEWEVVDEEPPLATDNEKIKHAFSLASEVAKHAAITVFNAVIDDQEVHKHDSWMFNMDWFARDGVPRPWAKPIPNDALVVSLTDLPKRLLAPNGLAPTNKELADLATACNQRLAQRMHEASKSRAA
ncbi:phage antirepressor N-terminal domain-containing protein [Delftia acidovorans]